MDVVGCPCHRSDGGPCRDYHAVSWKYSSRAILNQGQETSQWAYYQAKSIKSYIYEIQKQKLELDTMASAVKPKAVKDKYAQLIAVMTTD